SCGRAWSTSTAGSPSASSSTRCHGPHHARPVVISATFIGYLAGGLVGALVATLAILHAHLPGRRRARWFIGHRDNAQVKAFVKGATAAAAGAIAGATVILTRQAVVDVPTGGIAALALAILLRFKVREPYIVAVGAVAGLLLH